MRKGLLTAVLSSGAILLTTLLSAQNANSKVAYAMTDITNQNGNWVYLRIMNTETGTFSGSLLNGSAELQVAFDAATKKQITEFPTNIADRGFNPRPAFSSGVAAMAFDSRHNRIYYTPMFIDQLRYYDLKTQQVFYVNMPFTNKTAKSSDQGNIITRMVFASDGYGYAMTNDATQLLRFSTGKKPEIVDLGALVDDPASKVSIHNSCSSFGGDMVADDDGNLYVFSARNNVFKVNIESRVATHLGTVTGLPTGFTINAAAVNENNQVLVGSAVESTSLFVVDIKTLAATTFRINGTVWHTSDLASSNLLVSGNRPTGGTVDLITARGNELGNNSISIYPNPVTNNQFTVQFANVSTGTYTVQLTDMMGRQLMQQVVNVGSEHQVQAIKLNPTTAKGMYLIKVMNEGSQSVFSTKIVLQ